MKHVSTFFRSLFACIGVGIICGHYNTGFVVAFGAGMVVTTLIQSIEARA
jgi:mannose/fructose/N-acetylgalactosamine-specific phosphotransferase system component IIC